MPKTGPRLGWRIVTAAAMADPVEPLDEADRGGGLALTEGRGRHARHDDVLAAGLAVSSRRIAEGLTLAFDGP